MRSRRSPIRSRTPIPSACRDGGLTVLAALFALIVQLMVPSAAMAAQLGRGDGAMVICTGFGVETVQASSGAPQDSKAFAGLPCLDCLAPAQAALPAPLLVLVPAVYEIRRVEAPPRARLITPPARAPPRPPGQGPPVSDI